MMVDMIKTDVSLDSDRVANRNYAFRTDHFAMAPLIV
ncbi:hypothetical protein CAEBREN_20438 [Caenorhabditis brenneri]|uniref:Uncharacterized protein n=1 Tax=Caenorhabditis brenneri TaxID=135651 RepID=G0NUH0_CAEBE|nr:hypothetical protein CAEBREN_20438 [Caenorhabditis brenneri]